MPFFLGARPILRPGKMSDATCCIWHRAEWARETAYVADLDGVAFGVIIVGVGRTQKCLVTYEALTDAMGANPTQTEQMDWFLAHRSDIEDVAIRKFDNNLLEADGTICLNSRDLNPHLFR